MSHVLRSGRRLLRALRVLAILALLFSMLPAAGPVAAQGADKLSRRDRELLATARATGQASVTLLIAA